MEEGQVANGGLPVRACSPLPIYLKPSAFTQRKKHHTKQTPPKNTIALIHSPSVKEIQSFAQELFRLLSLTLTKVAWPLL